MNERIKELAMCNERIQYFFETGPVQRAAIEQFAELIVQECMRMCEVTKMSFVTHNCDVEASGAITVKQFIADHFGVE